MSVVKPIDEYTNSSGTYVNVFVSVDRKELEKLPKYNSITDYMVSREVKESIYQRSEIIWELPKDNNQGFDLFYRHYKLKVEFLLSSILIPIDIVISEYPELVSRSGQFCIGISPNKEILFKREFLIKKILL
jgi:hypothetical protein